MKVLGKHGMELARIALETKKGEPILAHASVPAANITGDARITLDCAGDELVARIKMNGWAMNAVVTLDDVAAVKGVLSGNLIKFVLRGMMKKSGNART